MRTIHKTRITRQQEQSRTNEQPGATFASKVTAHLPRQMCTRTRSSVKLPIIFEHG